MGRSRESKVEIVKELKERLSQTQMAIVIDYQGLSVAEIMDLRDRLRPTGTDCKVTKNTLMSLAVEGDRNWEAMNQFLKGTSAFLLVRDDLGGAIKAYQKFQKDTKKTEFRGGVMQGQALNEQQVQAITELPTKEELMAQIAGALNSLATKLAIGVKEVPSSLCRGINEVPVSIGRGIQAIANKEQENAINKE
ncbi:50S ribosomal protein L10 [Gloeocapsa sp. PCC 73106]|uniref:50S ribosomal protein L10 n=1 Tax=Gloeocapsa sp. PCC 73106 TaxID=102232 RepID=UPI0002ABA886|nr:50S ribosomal protein L10 [Gloeocapsa sp. PCC 73106]ELR98586.1 ribosomal protein L10 [Gloeocapsa sp. PCC 73106]